MSTSRLPHALALTALLAALPLSASAQSTIPDNIRARLIQIGFASPYAASDSILPESRFDGLSDNRGGLSVCQAPNIPRKPVLPSTGA